MPSRRSGTFASGYEDTSRYERPRGRSDERHRAVRSGYRTPQGADDPYVSVLNLMELRSVLSKKKQFERNRIDRIENRITARTTVTFPDASDMLEANRLQSETLLYPMDALVLAAAEAVDATLVSFDSELLDHGAKQPADVV
nr:PIN domain-containing protein [Halorientalis pallida]